MRKPMTHGASEKVFLAANPWPLAAAARRAGLPTDRFRESDLVPDGQVLVLDLDAMNRLDYELSIPDLRFDSPLRRLGR